MLDFIYFDLLAVWRRTKCSNGRLDSFFLDTVLNICLTLQIPMAHHYYYARMNGGFGSWYTCLHFFNLCLFWPNNCWISCATCLEEILNMTLTLTWTGNPSAQAWDTGYGLRAFRRDCSSVPSCNCICVGEQGTIGTNGGSIGSKWENIVIDDNLKVYCWRRININNAQFWMKMKKLCFKCSV